MLKGKNVVLGVTGSIAAYKIADLASMLVKAGAEVDVIETENAARFITPMTFETLTKHKCIVDTFDRDFEFDVKHISLAKKADVCLIAPASADIIGKIANGIADDMLSTTVMAMKCPVIISPAMNTNMYENPIVQENLHRLEGYGYEILQPAEGHLACGDTGKGKMPEPETLFAALDHKVGFKKCLAGKNVLISAGPTREDIDPVRFISNHSTGKMGYAIAKAAAGMGADVTLVSGPVNLSEPDYVKTINVISAEDMYKAVTDNFESTDIVIMSAAVADYTPAEKADHKIKKNDGGLSLSMKRTKDILKTLGERKNGQFLCGFSMETEDLIENSTKKLLSKHLDMIAANSLRTAGAGFGTDTNVITLITKENIKELPLESKDQAAVDILESIAGLLNSDMNMK
ncbi:MAG: bifunctional phosphopantothenoylcysteine decarboxylase/phosphopantothenate--cysteine ligase CoaBC [Lachnospiraceae bacterium]|jgi:phosphopantothenoylcysteine decarboxylase/phosphopantothenate--cysteine ligase|nr:bifunctional phosphopantothenoylcysteine decarboxylase/phosphopantothenate--cysteine ligase CoaBC [Lachnospiraceae bacterium]MEE3460645.1 bifunctional phosphopantothenoylcysteine decarboxylase/phosphopantothenate--cysteine ligase CoaBC [Lachnospiraceae bacterium]